MGSEMSDFVWKMSPKLCRFFGDLIGHPFGSRSLENTQEMDIQRSTENAHVLSYESSMEDIEL